MADENISALFDWGRSLVQTAGAAGFPMASLPESMHIGAFVQWAQSVNSGLGAMVPLPALTADSDYQAALAWAKALDGTARGMGAQLPPLP